MPTLRNADSKDPARRNGFLFLPELPKKEIEGGENRILRFVRNPSHREKDLSYKLNYYRYRAGCFCSKYARWEQSLYLYS